MKKLIIALCLLASPAMAGKIGTAMSYEGWPHKTVKTDKAVYFVLRHKKGDESVLILLNKAFGDKAERQAIIDDHRGFYDVGADYARSIGCKPKGTIKDLHWNMIIVPYNC